MKILFAADVSFHYFGNAYPGDEAALSAMAEAKACFDRADFSVINLETTFGDKKSCTPIPKSGPNQISAPDFRKYIEALAPSAACLANNHAGDFGGAPLLSTMDFLASIGCKPFGAGKSIHEAYLPAKLEKDGTRVALIGVCENEFGSAGEEVAGSAGYSLGRVTAAIKTARSERYTPVIFFHGGNEHHPFPSPMKKELYRHFIDIGAGAVVAMHTHCPQGYEIYEGAPIIYSMGNFYFPAPPYPTKPRYKVWAYGYMSLLAFKKEGIGVETIPYRQDFDGIHILKGEELLRFEKYLRFISLPIGDDALLQKYFDAWCIKQNWLASFVKLSSVEKSDPAAVRNFLSCEAHNEVLKNEALLRFEGRAEEAGALIAEIEALQEMEIPR